MNSLFASNFIYSFQIFSLTLFLVIILNLHKEVLAPVCKKARSILLYLFDYLVFVNAIILEKANSVYSCQNYLPLTLSTGHVLLQLLSFRKKSLVFRIMTINLLYLLI